MNKQNSATDTVAQRPVSLRSNGNLMRFTVSISKDVGERARRVAFEEIVSESSLFEVALRLLLDRRGHAEVAETLRQHGATRRRPPAQAIASPIKTRER